jgi:replicative DNA helicase
MLMSKAEKVQTDEIILFKHLPRTFYNARSLGVSTGWHDLDGIIGGIRQGELTIISADTGAGKTTFCINLLCNLLKADPSGFWINSWEMDYEVIVRKVANIILGGQLKFNPFTATQISDFENWMEKNNALINPKQSKADIVSLRKQVELAVKVYGVKYILLDHLDYISGAINARDNHERIAEAVIAIHQIALEFKVHIFLIAHPKQSDDKTGVVHMGQLKGSAAIKQYADNIFMLHNMQQLDLSTPDNRFKIAVPKNRFLGTKGEVILRYVSEIDGYVDNTLPSRTINSDN